MFILIMPCKSAVTVSTEIMAPVKWIHLGSGHFNVFGVALICTLSKTHKINFEFSFFIIHEMPSIFFQS